jgi:hypothetical protein
MPSVQEWRAELETIAEQLREGALQWALARDTQVEMNELTHRMGMPRSDSPWASLPQAEAVLELVAELRRIAAELQGVPDPPESLDP